MSKTIRRYVYLAADSIFSYKIEYICYIYNMERVQIPQEYLGPRERLGRISKHSRESITEARLLVRDVVRGAAVGVVGTVRNFKFHDIIDSFLIIIAAAMLTYYISSVSTCLNKKITNNHAEMSEFVRNVRDDVDVEIEHMNRKLNDLWADGARLNMKISKNQAETHGRIDAAEAKVAQVAKSATELDRRVSMFEAPHQQIFKVLNADPRWEEPILHQFYVVHGCLGELSRRFAAGGEPMWATIDRDENGEVPTIRKYGLLKNVLNITAAIADAYEFEKKCSAWDTQWMICEEPFLIKIIDKDVLEAMKIRYIEQLKVYASLSSEVKSNYRYIPHPCSDADQKINKDCVTNKSWLIGFHRPDLNEIYDYTDIKYNVYTRRCYLRWYLIEFQVE